MRRLATLGYLVFLCGVVFTATVWGNEQFFGYFNQPALSSADRAPEMAEHGTFANVTMNVRLCHPEDWEAARANGLKVIVLWPAEFWVGDATAPALDWGIPIDWNRPMWSGCTLSDGSPERAWTWYYTIVAHREEIAGFLLADEADGNCLGQTFPNWTPASLEACAKKLEWNAASLRGIFSVHNWFPPIWVNYTSAWVNGLRMHYPGYRLPGGVDWFSFDSYQPWDRCWGNVSCPQLIAALKANMSSSQRLVLIPRVFRGSYLGWNPSDLEVIMHGLLYLAYAQGDPQVIGMMPFLEFGPNGAGSVPLLREHVKAWGRLLTGRE